MSIPTLELTPNAETVLERRYLRRDRAGNPIETPSDMLDRVASDIASAETEWGGDSSAWAGIFLEEMTSLRFLPNSPTLMNAGRELGQLAACFVLPVEDSLDSIFDTLKLAAKIHQSGGGTGFSFSQLRPRGDVVRSTHGVSSGPVSFLEVYDAATERIKQGSFRRGANMGILEVEHPDILEFIDAKRGGGITNFNISVAVTEDWMRIAAAGGDYELINPRDGSVAGSLSAGEVLDRIAAAAWATGDPGIVFLDRMNRPRTNPTPQIGRITATNPCGEQPLLPYEACVLGSINVGLFLEGSEIDWASLGQTVGRAVRFLDDAVERSRYPVDEIAKLHRDGNRKIGLGIMGWADLLVRLGIPYDSDGALALGDELMGFVSSTADEASQQLAIERGSFPNWDRSVYGTDGENRPMRNATRTTIAPTGTISIIAGCSSGIEPLFALSYHRRVLDGSVLTEVNPDFRKVVESLDAEDLVAEVAQQGSIRGIDRFDASTQAVFVTAHDITPEWHVRHQATFQRQVDNAVSKTINLPAGATVPEIRAIYLMAADLGCTGITVYRDGSKKWQVLNTGQPSGTDLGSIEGSAPSASEDTPVFPPQPGQSMLAMCPTCGNLAFEFAEACGKCHACGHSTC